jgi:class 3 adenylate cyclase
MTSPQTLLEPERFSEPALSGIPRPKLRVVPAPGAERKFVTVLFADVKGSMGLSGTIALEEWWTVIGDLFELMCEGVYRSRGWVGNFTGDGIVAVFEPLVEDEPTGATAEHAHRACEAALWIREAIAEPADQVRSRFGLDLSVRLGLNSGEVLTGTIGDRFSRYYTAAGYAVGLARRMESLAEPGKIYITEHTALLLGAAVGLVELGAFEVKGAHFPLKVFELLGAGRTARGTMLGDQQLGREQVGRKSHPGTNQQEAWR